MDDKEKQELKALLDEELREDILLDKMEEAKRRWDEDDRVDTDAEYYSSKL